MGLACFTYLSSISERLKNQLPYRTVRCISFTRSFSLCIRNAYPIRLSDHAQTFSILKFLSLESSCVKFSIHSWFTTKSSILLRFFSVERTNRKKIESEALEMIGELQDCIYVAHFISNFEQFKNISFYTLIILIRLNFTCFFSLVYLNNSNNSGL